MKYTFGPLGVLYYMTKAFALFFFLVIKSIKKSSCENEAKIIMAYSNYSPMHIDYSANKQKNCMLCNTDKQMDNQ